MQLVVDGLPAGIYRVRVGPASRSRCLRSRTYLRSWVTKPTQEIEHALDMAAKPTDTVA